MSEFVEIDEKKYRIEDLSHDTRNLLFQLQSIEANLADRNNLIALLNKAKKAYIEDLKSEMLATKAGLDFLNNEEASMPNITVDGIEYNTEDLSDNGKAQLASLQFLEVQMQKLNNEIAIFQTAKNAYVAALKAERKR